MTKLKNIKISIIGLGYVGLPLAVEFGKYYKVTGFDPDKSRIKELKVGYDRTFEVSSKDLVRSKGLIYSYDLYDISQSNIYIIAVPTPINKLNRPDLSILLKATKTVGKVLNKKDIVIYESTVYPGVTEDVCVPVLEKVSGLIFNTDFFCGYSPERINPGDKKHKITNIVKVTSGSTPKIAKLVNQLYLSIIKAGTYLAPSIQVAEAAKVIENTQRDLNIALMNEFAIIFNKLDLDTDSILKAASTKWNFSPYRPGLVGGHCIGVDPYYLTYKSEMAGYTPQIILSGRKINNSMGKYVSTQLVQLMKKRKLKINNARVLILGLSFKENCSDLRNTRVVDIMKNLLVFKMKVDIHDPIVDKVEAFKKYGISLISNPKKIYDAIILAVPHKQFVKKGQKYIRSFGKESNIFYDIKSVFRKNESDLRL